MRDGTLVIPRLFFNCHLVSAMQIKSIEKYAVASEIVAVLIGRVNRSSIFIERRIFANGAEFDGFLRFLDDFQSEISLRRIEALGVEPVKRWQQSSGVIAAIASVLLVTYIVSSGPGIEQLSHSAVLLGGLVKGAVWTGPYRMASSFFLHSTPFHLGFNLLALAIIGQNISVIFGRVRLIIILFCSAIMGSIVSLAFSPYETVIGASGGILGLIGAYSVICARCQQQIPGSVSVSRGRVLILLAVQMLFDFIAVGTDIYSHLGGFLFGLLYACDVLRRNTPADAAESSTVEIGIATCLVLAYAIGLTYYFILYERLF